MHTDTSTTAGQAVLSDRYPALDELTDAARQLTARHPDLCTLRTLGTSRAGRPLHLLTIGRTNDHVLVVSGAHADEFSGRASILELAHRVLAQPELHSTTAWNFLLCLDPDGAHLAEDSRHARTLPHYFATFFRPAAEEQPEWAPAIGANLPESRILLDLIDDLRPRLQFSLHSTDVGGTFIQTTRDLPGLAEPFVKSAADHGIPLDSGSFDTFWLKEPGPAVFVMDPHDIDRQESTTGMLTVHPGDGPDTTDTGVRATTWFTPQRHGGDTLIIEVPVWASQLDTARPTLDPATHLANCADLLRRHGQVITELLDTASPHLADTPLLRAVHTPLTAMNQLADQWDPGAGGQRLLSPGLMTPARLEGIELWAHRLPVRTAALLRRALDPTHARTAPVTDRIDHLLREWIGEYEQRFRPVWIPVADQAAHQANTVLAAVEVTRTRPS
ncbi:M14 family zinc carboxypeptidase [Kitasatospora aureofaciens]|uniref:M14 family zinc carboxypeptidase n=1 Tax=Kitasatospora aureofaciens TaxID=1894 RepID=UPI000526FFE3|nr:M14 family zinc carboxypeptidase [Kitasatospora aureofaciens]